MLSCWINNFGAMVVGGLTRGRVDFWAAAAERAGLEKVGSDPHFLWYRMILIH